MLGIRQKLSLGFAGLLAIILIIGAESISLFSQLGNSIDVIIRENYRSVIACQQMKEALERIDSGALFSLLGYDQEGIRFINENTSKFEKALDTELNNITLPGEGEKATKLHHLFEQFKSHLNTFLDEDSTLEIKREIYFGKIFKLFEQMKTEADAILHMNQQNMSEANDRARLRAASAQKQMYLFLILGSAISAIYILLIGRWILRPITRLRSSANEIAAGNLDLVVTPESADEIGQLSKSFNAMAESLRRVRHTREARIAYIQKTIEEAFNVLPEAIAVVNLEGTIEIATSAAKAFDLVPNRNIRELPFGWLKRIHRAVAEDLQYGELSSDFSVQILVNGEERYFHPRAVPIRNSENELVAVLIIISDVTCPTI